MQSVMQFFCDRKIDVISDNVGMTTTEPKSVERRTMSLPMRKIIFHEMPRSHSETEQTHHDTVSS